MKCNIIGNGYSQTFFSKDDGYTISLNYNSIDNPDLIFAVDSIALDYLEANNFFNTPSVISNKSDVVNPCIIDRVDPHRKNLPFELEGYDRYKSSFNVGHCSYVWACKQNFSEIHLWGFDVLFDKSLISLSDSIYKHTPEYKRSNKFLKKAELYNSIWDKIINIPTFIHIPEGENILIDNKNLKVIHHGIR